MRSSAAASARYLGQRGRTRPRRRQCPPHRRARQLRHHDERTPNAIPLREPLAETGLPRMGVISAGTVARRGAETVRISSGNLVRWPRPRGWCATFPRAPRTPTQAAKLRLEIRRRCLWRPAIRGAVVSRSAGLTGCFPVQLFDPFFAMGESMRCAAAMRAGETVLGFRRCWSSWR
jgi:hypothetical protein